MSSDEVCDAIIELLPMSENNLGFVSPTHCIPQMITIVEELRKRGHNPTIIYNTNGYDLPETIRSLDRIVDVWLPDFKYSDDSLAEEISQAPDYSKYALSSLKAMVHQSGTTLHTDDRGIARRGIIIRHLVLPGFTENSVGVLKLIAEHISPNLHISLMSQYYPPDNFLLDNHNSQFANLSLRLSSRLNPVHARVPMKSGVSGRKSLHRTITRNEYETVLQAFHSLGFTSGWLQDFESHLSYRPDFSKKHPFEEK